MIFDRLTQKAKTVLLSMSKQSPNGSVSVASLFDAISQTFGMGNILMEKVSRLSFNDATIVNLNQLVEEAFHQSAKFKHAYVGTEHLLLAVLQITASPDIDKVKSEMLKIGTFPIAVKTLDVGKKTPILDAFGINLNQILRKSGAVEREEIDDVLSVLLQKDNSNPLIVGDSGVGKHCLIQQLVHRINTYDVPLSLAGYRIYEFDFLAFLTSVSNKEGVDFGLTLLLEELAQAEKTILYIKDLQNIFVATNVGLTIPFAFSMLKNDLNHTQVKLVSTMTSSLYDRIITENEQVLAGFSLVEVSEPSEEKVLEILAFRAKELSGFHNIEIPQKLVKTVYTKAKDGIKGTSFPQKGVELLDQACSRLIMKSDKFPVRFRTNVEKRESLLSAVSEVMEVGNYATAVKLRTRLRKIDKNLLALEEGFAKRPKYVLTKQEIDEAFLGISGDTPEEAVDFEALGSLAEKMKKKIIGQGAAVDLVTKSLVRSKLGLRSRKRPAGNFLFLGPTGVGKTELAKVLARCAFGEKGLIRLDMSDFGEKHMVARLIGAPPGYVGYGEGGDLTGKIDANPDSVVLFDEIEKAHPDVLNILLQIMEEGELSDARGFSHDFSRAVVVLTSNMGTSILQKREIGFGDNVRSSDIHEKRLRENAKKILKPELINRFDEIVVFKKLGRSDQMKIFDILLAEVRQTLKKQKIGISVDMAAKKLILKQGYSDEFGARSLRRTVETQLLDRIAEILLKEKKRPLKLVATVNGNAVVVKGGI